MRPDLEMDIRIKRFIFGHVDGEGSTPTPWLADFSSPGVSHASSTIILLHHVLVALYCGTEDVHLK